MRRSILEKISKEFKVLPSEVLFIDNFKGNKKKQKNSDSERFNTPATSNY
ncbi:MAG: hypothetical protein ACP5N2_03860 [Candidatus Nanoarchaeia archaeon]